MDFKDINSLDEYILKKNIKMFIFALNIFIYSNKFYGTRDLYNDAFLSNITTIIKSYKSQYFNAGLNDIDMDLMLGVDISIDSNGQVYNYTDYFTFQLNFKLDRGVKGLKIINLKRGDTLRLGNKKNLLNQILVPSYPTDMAEEIAEDFVKEFSPDNLETPAPLSVFDIASKLGLEIQSEIMSPTIKGMITFRDTYITPSHKEREIITKQGTIVVNEHIDIFYSNGVKNNTIIHECIHWWLHRKFIECKLLFNGDQSLIICPSDNELNEKMDSDLYKIEMQARILAPLILMPREASIIKFEELLFKYRQGPYDSRTIYEKALVEFAEYFGVTPTSAANRLSKLGFNDTLQQNINLKVKKKSKTYFLSYWDYCEMQVDERVSQLIERKLLIYVDGFIVPNLERIVKYDSDKEEYHLTEYALKNITQFAIPFNVKWDGDMGNDDVLYHALYHSGTAAKRVLMNDDGFEVVVKTFKMMGSDPRAKEFFRTFRGDDTQSCNSKYSEYLILLMDRHKISIRTLAEKAKVYKSTIDNYRKLQEQNYTVEATLKLCIGMNAYPYETLNLLELMDCPLKDPNTKLKKAYLKLITEAYDKDLDYWNNYLHKLDLPLL